MILFYVLVNVQCFFFSYLISVSTAKLKYIVADIGINRSYTRVKSKCINVTPQTTDLDAAWASQCHSLWANALISKPMDTYTVTSLKREQYLSTAIGQKHFVSQKNIQNQLFVRQNIEHNIVKSSLLYANADICTVLIVWPCGQSILLYTSKQNVLILSFEAEHLSNKVLMFLLQSGGDQHNIQFNWDAQPGLRNIATTSFKDV